jgi:hypothetical protein
VVASHPDRWVPWTYRDTHRDTHRDTCRNGIELDANHRKLILRVLCLAGWVGFSCIQGKARLGLAVFGIRSGLVWSCLAAFGTK